MQHRSALASRSGECVRRLLCGFTPSAHAGKLRLPPIRPLIFIVGPPAGLTWPIRLWHCLGNWPAWGLWMVADCSQLALPSWEGGSIKGGAAELAKHDCLIDYEQRWSGGADLLCSWCFMVTFRYGPCMADGCRRDLRAEIFGGIEAWRV